MSSGQQHESDSIEDILKDGDIDLSSFKVHTDLNREFWDYENKLYPQFKTRLLSIAKDFVDSLDFGDITSVNPYSIIHDVVLVGSIASFNYSKYSDVDLHILMDVDKLSDDPKVRDLFKKYFNQARMIWNLDHLNLTIKGYDVEIYVQDINEDNAANGIYSLYKNDWVKFPTSMAGMHFNSDYIKAKAKRCMEQIEYLESLLEAGESDPERIGAVAQLIKDKVIKSRRAALSIPGSNEMVEPNIIFKVLRRSGHIGRLNDIITKAYDLKNTIVETNMSKITFKQLKQFLQESFDNGVECDLVKETNKFPPINKRDVPRDLARKIETEFNATIEDNGNMKLPYVYVTIPLERDNPKALLRGKNTLGRAPKATIPNFNNVRRHQFEDMVTDAGWFIVDRLPPDEAEPDYCMLISPYKNPSDSISDELDAQILKSCARDKEQQDNWGKDDLEDEFFVEEDL